MWNEWPVKRSIPSMRARRGLASVPLAQMTKRADMRSPRSVSRCQRWSLGSQIVDVTVVWNTARSYRSYLRAIAWQWAKISGPWA